MYDDYLLIELCSIEQAFNINEPSQKGQFIEAEIVSKLVY